MQGSETATVSERPRAAISAEDVFTRWSAEAASKFDSQRSAAQVVKFVGVDFERETKHLRPCEYLPRLRQGECLVLAEDIHEGQGSGSQGGLCRPPGLHGGQHLPAEQVGVTLRIIPVLGGDGMCAQEGGHQLERTLGIQRQDGLQQLDFRFRVQTVTRLDFGGGGAVGEHALQAWARFCHELLHGCLPGFPDSGEDTPAGCQDVQVFCACHFHLKFNRPVSRPDHVGVRVDEPGHDSTAGGIQAFPGWAANIPGVVRFDYAVTDQDSTVLNDMQVSQGLSPLGTAGEGQ